jgi:hypothetical protein
MIGTTSVSKRAAAWFVALSTDDTITRVCDLESAGRQTIHAVEDKPGEGQAKRAFRSTATCRKPGRRVLNRIDRITMPRNVLILWLGR